MDKKKKVLKVVKKIGSMGIKVDSYTWPPCIGILHQPKRPKKKF